MVEAEFDSIVDEYRSQHAQSIGFAGGDVDYFARYKIEELLKVCEKTSLDPATILDFGAGIGNSLKPMRKAFPNARIKCLDVSAESLKVCERQNIGNMSTHIYDGQTLPFDDGAVDAAFTACVFHHIPEEDHVRLLSEIRRCLSPAGRFVLFEHNPFNPLTRLAVKRCPFDENAVLISAPEMKRRLLEAGFNEVSTRFHVFFPEQLASLRRFEPALSWLPLGGQYLTEAQ